MGTGRANMEFKETEIHVLKIPCINMKIKWSKRWEERTEEGVQERNK